jgi:hypothetical protein
MFLEIIKRERPDLLHKFFSNNKKITKYGTGILSLAFIILLMRNI